MVCDISISTMSKATQLAQQIRNLKVTKGFTVKGEKERQKVCREAKFLRDHEMISFDVVTSADGKGNFKVAAI